MTGETSPSTRLYPSYAITSANTETWNYNAKGELTQADHSSINTFDRSFEFDGIGNRKKSADSLTLPATDNYTSNALNQYSAVGVVARSFDDDGNLLDNGEHLYVWDAENRLTEVKKKSDNSTVATYAYDAYSRRISKDVAGVVTNFVYDGWNPIAEFSSVTLSKSYTWGMDLSGSMQGAGGVGGLLSVNDTSATYFTLYDGNGNAVQYVDTTGVVVAHYEYDAFGQAIPSSANTKFFTHQFSTKQLDTESGLYYYGYRYYNSKSGRWIKRDPLNDIAFHESEMPPGSIEARNNGDSIMYSNSQLADYESSIMSMSFIKNDSVNNIDLLGLCTIGAIADLSITITFTTRMGSPFTAADPRTLVKGLIRDKVEGKIKDAADKRSKLIKAIHSAKKSLNEMRKSFGLIAEFGSTAGFILDKVEVDAAFKCCKCIEGKNTWQKMTAGASMKKLYMSPKDPKSMAPFPAYFVGVVVSAAEAVAKKCPLKK